VRRLAFFGTPPAAVAPLRAIVAAGHDVRLVVTQPDRRRARGSAESPSPVKAAASALGLAVRTPARAREVLDELAAERVELGVVVAFGQLLPAALLAAAPDGFVNLHFSLLPRWRGAAPVERALLAGDAHTGVTLMRLDEGLDTGPVFASVETRIGDVETSGELGARLVALGTDLLVDCLPHLADGGIEPAAQHGEPTYAMKLGVEEFHIDPLQPAETLARLVRAGNPRPGAWTTVGGRRLKVLRSHPTDGGPPVGVVDEHAVLGCASGALRLDEVQPEGGPVMEGVAWRIGRRGAVRLDA
jgi:methionyl-tRNA formyltransferase